MLCNALEPEALVDAFLKCPPEEFEAFVLCQGKAPAFTACFDALTTLDPSVKRRLERIPGFKPFAGRFLRIPTLFIGTTVSEYARYDDSSDVSGWAEAWKLEMGKARTRAIILKDVPLNSPLLSDEENGRAGELLAACRAAGFTVLSGQALAYVPISFQSLEQFFERFSTARRKDFRRKLKKRAEVSIEELAAGDPFFSREGVLKELYSLYLDVYSQSEIHFDKLTYEFLRNALTDSGSGAVVFIYRKGEKLLGYNLCFVYRNNLVDKFIGLCYPDAREMNIYFISWFHNIEYALRKGLKFYVSGWTDPGIKATLGAEFTFTYHAVYLKNPVMRMIMRSFRKFFESDEIRAQEREKA